MPSSDAPQRPSWQGALAGGIGGCGAVLITHPIELLKVRFQLRGELQGAAVATAAAPPAPAATTPVRPSIYRTAVKIFRADGLSGFYKGLSASLLRQAIFTSTRFGIYDQYKKQASRWFSPSSSSSTHPAVSSSGSSRQKQSMGLPMYAQIAGSVAAGAMGAVVSCPVDIVLIRMQADGRLPVEKRRNYSNVLSGMLRIVHEEGMAGLYRGVVSNVYRASVVTACQLVSYDTAKDFLLTSPATRMTDGLLTHFLSGIFAGVVTTLVASPVDVIRTRYMNSIDAAAAAAGSQAHGHIKSYSSPIDCAVRTVRTEGLRALYKGSFVYSMRVMPHVTTMFLVVEWANGAIDKLRML